MTSTTLTPVAPAPIPEAAPTPTPTPAAEPALRSTRSAARLAGIGYIALFALAIFANFFVRESMIVAGDAQATAANILESQGLFRVGMVAFLAIFLIDLVIAWALHLLFRPADADLSLVAAWSRLVYTVFLGVALVYFFQGLQFLSGAGFLETFGRDQLDAQALVAFESFNSTWLIGLVAFGLHLVLVGLLVLRTNLAPRALGLLLMVAGLAYVADTVANMLLVDYADHRDAFTAMVAVPSIVAEGWFGLWLLLRGGRQDAIR